MKVNKVFVLFMSVTVLSAVQGGPLKTEENSENWWSCASEKSTNGLFNCAAFKLLRSLDTYNEKHTIEIVPGITIVNEDFSPSKQSRQLKEEEIPKEPLKRANKLVEMIIDSFSRLLSGKSLKIQLPSTSTETLARALEEGRGKMKKMRPFMYSLGTSMLTMMPLFMGGVTMLTTKAMIMGKMAFLVSFILFVQYIFSNRSTNWLGYPGNGYGTNYGYGYGASTQYGVPNTLYGSPGTGFGTNNLGWNNQRTFRSLNVAEEPKEEETAQELAYSSYHPQTK